MNKLTKFQFYKKIVPVYQFHSQEKPHNALVNVNPYNTHPGHMWELAGD